MTKSVWTIPRTAASLIAIVAVVGFFVSVANYFNPQSGIAGEPGTILVIASTAILAVFGWLLGNDSWRGNFFRIFIVISTLLNIAGTGFAGYLLHSQTLFWLMIVGFVGWLVYVLTRRSAKP